MEIITLFNELGQAATINNLTYQIGQNSISICDLKNNVIADIELNDGYCDLTVYDSKNIDNSYYTEVETTDDVENAIKKYSNLGDQKMITLTMDNGSCNDFKKISINFESVETVEELAKRYFNWRTPTKKYKSIYERLLSIGSSRYDAFILYCHKLGY